MERKLKYIVIEYSDKDLSYIDDLCEYIEQSCDEIISFFDIKKFGEKVNLKLWDDLGKFRDCYKKKGYSLDENGEVCKWVCGFSCGNMVHTLCLEEYNKTKGHDLDTLEDLKHLVMHEFAHTCHNKIANIHTYLWLVEGLAISLSHQYDNKNKKFNCTLEQTIKGRTNYINYYTMFSYVLEAYGRDYILELIKNFKLLENDTPKLYEEVKNNYRTEEMTISKLL